MFYHITVSAIHQTRFQILTRRRIVKAETGKEARAKMLTAYPHIDGSPAAISNFWILWPQPKAAPAGVLQ